MSQLHKPQKYWSFPQRALYVLVAAIIPRVLRFFFRFEVFGDQNLKEFPEGTGLIFCGNHQSHLDSLMVASALVRPFGNRRFLAILGSGKAMRENFIFRMTLLLGAFPIFKENPEPCFNYARDTLKRGLAIFITPQGRRFHRTPFHDYFNFTKEGRTGIGRIILNTNCEIPVAPLWIHGAAEALRPGQIMPRFGSYISVSFGEPILFTQFSKKGGWSNSDPDYYSTARKITDIIMNAIRDQLIDYEKYYIGFLEWKFNKKIEDLTFSGNYEKRFNILLHKLARVPPQQIKRYLEVKTKELIS